MLVAVSVAASGGEMPKFGVSGGESGSGSNSSIVEWAGYLSRGINAALIERHFEGVVSALGCMYVGWPLTPPFFWISNGDGNLNLRVLRQVKGTNSNSCQTV